MNILIGDKSYSYSFIGESLHRPSVDSFGINQDDISTCKEYETNKHIYENKLDKVTSVISIIPGIIAYIGEVIYIGYSFSSNPEEFIDIPHNWSMYTSLLIMTLLITPLAVVMQGGILSIFIPKKLRKNIALRIVGLGPSVPPKWDNVKDYEYECEQFKKKEIDYYLQFSGIREDDYDLTAFGIRCINSFIEEIISYTNFQNGIIYKDNLRQEQKYWFELDPFEFEEEVAYWFEQQGYKASVTQKTGDGGIDIIVSNNEYIAYVQCKRYKTSKVDRPTLNALYGVVCADKVNQGIVVCLLGITEEAKEFARKVGIRVVTIDELAPEDDLFHHKINKNLLCVNPIQCNKNWVEIGNFKLNTNAYRKQEDVINQVSRWNDKELYHPMKYRGIFMCLCCQTDDFTKFQEWFNLKAMNTKHTKQQKKKPYRKSRNRHWRYGSY